MTNDRLLNVRRIGALVLAAAALIVSLAAGPRASADAAPADYARLLDIARSDYDANNERTSGAPQQQVVNGWFARDALSLQVLQLDDLLATQQAPPADQRLPLLGLIAVLAICLYAATSPAPRLVGSNGDGESAAAGDGAPDGAGVMPQGPSSPPGQLPSPPSAPSPPSPPAGPLDGPPSS